MASSIILPEAGCLALAWRCGQRASLGTQKMLKARYSSGSSGSAPLFLSATSLARCSSKASEMYFRKMRPRTTCLYSAASMLLRSLSAACQSLASKPSTAPLGPFRPLPAFAFRAIKFTSKVFLEQLQFSLPDHPAAKGVQLGPGQLRRLDRPVLPSVDRGEADPPPPRPGLLDEG